MTTEGSAVLNLEDYRAKSKDGTVAKVFTGRDRGEYVRENSGLDKLMDDFGHVEIIIPDKIYSINPSFFEELFVNIINKIGKEEFLQRVKFTSLGKYNYVKPLNEAITRILRSKSALE